MIRSRFFRLGDAACVFCAVALAAFYASRLVLVVWPRWFSLISTFAPLLFVALPLVMAWALIRRSRMALVGAGLLLTVFAIVYGPLFVPRRIAAARGNAITVMTFNLGPSVAKPDEITAAIAAEDADIAVVQELTPAAERAIRATLDARYPFRVLDSGDNGRGLLSRYPIGDVAWLPAEDAERPTLTANLAVGNHTVRLFAPHPLPPDITWLPRLPVPIGMDTARQERQLLDVLHRAQQSTETVLVMGDFNTTDQTQAYASLSATLHDAFREAGWGFGFTFPHGLHLGSMLPNASALANLPLPGPLIRLDFIFHSGDMAAQSARVGCAGGSDHCYVVARLAWR